MSELVKNFLNHNDSSSAPYNHFLTNMITAIQAVVEGDGPMSPIPEPEVQTPKFEVELETPVKQDVEMEPESYSEPDSADAISIVETPR